MNQIIFNQDNNQMEPQKRITSRFFRRMFLLIITIVIIAGVIGLVIFYKNKNTSDQKVSDYSAIFLSNGQVYFGKIDSIKDNYLVLSDIYYIQPSNNGQSQNSSGGSIALIKLGNELHGPTNKMFINSTNILFYENLRLDSKVVQSIQASK